MGARHNTLLPLTRFKPGKFPAGGHANNGIGPEWFQPLKSNHMLLIAGDSADDRPQRKISHPAAEEGISSRPNGEHAPRSLWEEEKPLPAPERYAESGPNHHELVAPHRRTLETNTGRRTTIRPLFDRLAIIARASSLIQIRHRFARAALDALR
ncbi:hypothetical protein FJW04_24940 [Mesorhizobium sp. B2-7-3]|uniref:hypothetical protein n=1 Tax=Mesorhizobium sp. B2-7-3 TaxID=2589907 RepID=UPI001126F26E|nr:hypothetical protein [Mesorhizobium sp. B2-7-3]TPJ11598.1 hypothetical protein FJW04_24940 [Mesorhizobium sp. B2-7-3]